MDSIVIVYWYTDGIRRLVAFENQARAEAYMNAHPYRPYYSAKVDIRPERVRFREKRT